MEEEGDTTKEEEQHMEPKPKEPIVVTGIVILVVRGIIVILVSVRGDAHTAQEGRFPPELSDFTLTLLS